MTILDDTRPAGDRRLARSSAYCRASRNRWFVAAGLLLVVAGGVHMVASGPVLSPVHASGLKPQIIMVLDVVWYNVAVMLFGAAILVLVASGRPAWRGLVGWSVAAWCGCGALLFLGFNLVWFGTVAAVPNWAAFLVVGAVLVVGLRRDAKAGVR